MNALLIPVKDLSCAKQRLADHLDPGERAELAWAMAQDVFNAVAAARGFDRVFVVSSYPPALQEARKRGWESIREIHQVSESESVDWASQLCAEWGVRSLLRLPIDLPLVRPMDIESLFQESKAFPGAVLVPSRDRRGTNALLRTPPGLFPSHFGPGSLARHLEEAERRGFRAQVVRNERIELDIDDLEDLRAFLAQGVDGTASGAWLASHGFLSGQAGRARCWTG